MKPLKYQVVLFYNHPPPPPSHHGGYQTEDFLQFVGLLFQKYYQEHSENMYESKTTWKSHWLASEKETNERTEGKKKTLKIVSALFQHAI